MSVFNDRFRFRAVDENTGKIYERDEFQIENYTSDGDDFFLNAFIMQNDDYVQLKLIQCTGKNDCNYRFIYEGDIVEDTDDHCRSEVKWSTDSLTFTIDGDHICDWDSDMLQVIGNIYENPKLLEKKL